MTTRERLAAMTDSGQFECLAIAALRKLDPDCAAVIHHGANAEGKTVKAPVDAWCLVPRSDPPRFVYIAATANKANGLSDKWVFDHRTYAGSKTKSEADDGDVLKAARAAEQRRGQRIFSTAQFRLILATNQIVGSDLQASVYGLSKELGFDPWIFEQTQLADYLDADGQYLRKVFLGVEAELLSYELLREIGQKSCSAHVNEFLAAGSHQPVRRFADRQIEEALQDQSRGLIYLLGAAGFGKSTTASAVLSAHLASEGCGIWLPAEIVETSTSLGRR